MKIKSSIAGIIVATSMVTVVGLSPAWAMKPNCTGQGWHMVSKSCPIKPADTWQQYDSGIYTQPITGNGFLR